MKVFKNAQLRNEPMLKDILVEDGKIISINNSCSHTPYNVNTEVIDLNGKLTLEPYCDPHIHLDYVFTSSSFGENKTGTLFDGIASWSDSKSQLSIDEVKKRAKLGINEQILGGTQYIRTHVDVTDPNLTCLKALLEVKKEYASIVDMQIVAFPQEGMYSFKDGDKLVEEALLMGADVVGAIPHFEYTQELGNKSVKKAVQLAIKYDKMVDIHCDETDDEMSRFLEVLAYEGLSNGISHKITASHTCAMGSYNNAYTFKLFNLLKQSQLNFISCPTENIHLQGRFDSYPKRRGLTRVKELYDAGINVCFAQDSICDPWYPLGNGNLMYVLDAGIHICQLTSSEYCNNALDLISINGAKTMGIEKSYVLKVGNNANFIVLNATNDFDAIRNRADALMSVREGNLLFKRDILINNFIH
ncbi:MAG: cytosine deaminase [Epulopiscium sp. Nele67-Bin002]|nr:MAG: cytosine deaminase [Epulopiscium sp. Nele67-Bin002]